MSSSSRSIEDSEESGGESGPEHKRQRTDSGSLDDSDVSVSDGSSSGTSSPVNVDDLHHHRGPCSPHEDFLRSSHPYQQMLNPAMAAAAGWMDLMLPYFQQPHLPLSPSNHPLHHFKRDFNPLPLPVSPKSLERSVAESTGKKLGFSISAILGYDR